MPDIVSSAVDGSSDAIVNAYDEILYIGDPFAHTHPDRLAALAILHGVEAAPVPTCRVLEIGCGDGANIVPMAATLADAQFVAFDYAARPVARAQQMVADLGLRNIRIVQRDLRDFSEDAGSFDYIIVHGLYSWVPLEVRRHLMPVIARHLAPRGVAYVSFNAFPGCRLRQAVWDMLRLHTKGCRDLKAKLAAARELIGLMVDSENPVSRGDIALRDEFKRLVDRPDHALYHDDLSATNDPLYFQEFVADAAGSGLTFLVEADLFTMTAGDFAPHVREALGRMDRLTREQYLDYLRFRPFRNSLLCHEKALPEFELHPERITGMYASPTQTVRKLVASGSTMSYKSDDARQIMELLLAHWPQTLPVTELVQWFAARKPPPGIAYAASTPLGPVLLELCIAGLLDLRTRPITPVKVAGERPKVFAPARWIGKNHDVVPNLYHDGIHLADPIARQLVTLLDGTRTRAELMLALGEACAGPDGAKQLESALGGLVQRAMLVA